MMAGMMTLILMGLLFALRTRHALVLEKLASWHQLAVPQRAAPRPRLRTSDRLFWVLVSRLWSGWADARSVRKLIPCSGSGRAVIVPQQPAKPVPTADRRSLGEGRRSAAVIGVRCL